MAQGSKIKIRSVMLKVGNDGGYVKLDSSHPLYDNNSTHGDAPRCVDIMFRGPPPSVHLPEQLGWCFGMCLKRGSKRIVVINSNGD